MPFKIIYILAAIIFSTTSAQAQTIREKINQQAKDPKTKENAAKADVYIVKKNTIMDSAIESREKRKCGNKKVRKSERLKG
jgi:FlaG/FlaF family flagellin (archaellin)